MNKNSSLHTPSMAMWHMSTPCMEDTTKPYCLSSPTPIFLTKSGAKLLVYYSSKGAYPELITQGINPFLAIHEGTLSYTVKMMGMIVIPTKTCETTTFNILPHI